MLRTRQIAFCQWAVQPIKHCRNVGGGGGRGVGGVGDADSSANSQKCSNLSAQLECIISFNLMNGTNPHSPHLPMENDAHSNRGKMCLLALLIIDCTNELYINANMFILIEINRCESVPVGFHQFHLTERKEESKE